MEERVPLTLITGGIALACLVIIFLLLAFDREFSFAGKPKNGTDAEQRMIDVKMPSGRTIKTESGGKPLDQQGRSSGTRKPLSRRSSRSPNGSLRYRCLRYL